MAIILYQINRFNNQWNVPFCEGGISLLIFCFIFNQTFFYSLLFLTMNQCQDVIFSKSTLSLSPYLYFSSYLLVDVSSPWYYTYLGSWHTEDTDQFIHLLTLTFLDILISSVCSIVLNWSHVVYPLDIIDLGWCAIVVQFMQNYHWGQLGTRLLITSGRWVVILSVVRSPLTQHEYIDHESMCQFH